MKKAADGRLSCLLTARRAVKASRSSSANCHLCREGRAVFRYLQSQDFEFRPVRVPADAFGS
jgi:hypothetical protein